MSKKKRKKAKQKIKAGLDISKRSSDTVTRWRYARDERPNQGVSEFDISRARGDARYEYQNNPHAYGFAETYDLYVVGDKGPRLKFFGHALDPSWNKENETFRDWVSFQWEKWCKESRVRDALSLAVRSMIVDGVAYVVASKNSKRKIFPVNYEVIEPQRVRNPNAMINGLYEFGYLVNGLIFDEESNLDGVVVLDMPVRDTDMFLTNKFHIIESQRVHILTQTILPGQSVGYSWFAPILEILGRIRDTTDAMAENMKNSAAIIASVESKHGYGHEDGIFGDRDGMNEEPFATRPLPRNNILFMPPETQLKAYKPEQPQSGFREAITDFTTVAGRGIGLPRNKSTGSSHEYNFSSARIDEQSFNMKISRLQIDLKETCLEPLFRSFYGFLYAEAVARFGLGVPLPDDVYFDFSFPKPPPNDPVVQAQANEINLKSGFLTHKMYYEDTYGEDFDDHIADIEQGKQVVPSAYGITESKNETVDVYRGVDTQREDQSGFAPVGENGETNVPV